MESEKTPAPHPVDAIIQLWENDAPVDETEPGKALLHIPRLHAKYTKLLSEHSRKIRALNYKYNDMKKLRWEYYQGRLDAIQLKEKGWEPFRFILKGDVQNYMDADQELARISARRGMHEEAYKYCESIIKEINNRVWELRSYIDWAKFVGGGG